MTGTQPYGAGATSQKGSNNRGSRILLRNTSAKNRALNANRFNSS